MGGGMLSRGELLVTIHCRGGGGWEEGEKQEV